MTKKLSKKEQELLTLVNKGGDDAGLLLLDRIHELEDLMAMHAEMMEKKMDGLKTELESKIPNLDLVATKIRGQDGQNGKDSEVAGPKGERGDKGDRGPEGKAGVNGRDGRDGLDGKDGRDAIDGKPADEEKIIEKIEKDIPKLGEPIRDALELLKGDERLDKSAIKDLKEELERIERVANTKKVIGGGSLSANMVQYVDLSSQLNGSTKTFYLEGDHQGIVAALGSSAPYVFRPTVDYTESGPNIVFDAAVDATISLAAGQSLIVLVKRKSI